MANNPAADTILNQAKAEARFIDRLFSLVPAQSDAPPQTPITMESKANQSYYVLRSLSVHRLTLEEFQRMKGMLVRREEYSQTENLAAVHFNPDNILKRMNFRFAEPVEKQAEDQAKEKAKEAS
ncbi:MAG: hypothetical protein A2Y76_02305 [Planctomycetes bacterium RBG_13_60_9]|nr:MAG: hypothetical protein A2Y76_02305 [Planctomycetes bacterium RBG_13_60_9]